MGNPNLTALLNVQGPLPPDYRPPQWSRHLPQTIMVVFDPGQGNTNAQYQPTGISATLPTSKTTYVFDCVILADHDQRLRKTEHPVQTGANISDHAFIEPASLTLDVGMSDAMDSYSPFLYVGSGSKSVAAYQTMILLMFSRIPLTITTRLRTYDSMIIESIRPQESAKTFGGLRMRVEFAQVFRAQVITTPSVSTLPQLTAQTPLGGVIPQQITPPQQAQNGCVGLTNVPCSDTSAVGKGFFSSVNVNNLPFLPPGS